MKYFPTYDKLNETRESRPYIIYDRGDFKTLLGLLESSFTVKSSKFNINKDFPFPIMSYVFDYNENLTIHTDIDTFFYEHDDEVEMERKNMLAPLFKCTYVFPKKITYEKYTFYGMPFLTMDQFHSAFKRMQIDFEKAEARLYRIDNREAFRIDNDWIEYWSKKIKKNPFIYRLIKKEGIGNDKFDKKWKHLGHDFGFYD